MVRPALGHGAGLWPFDGRLASSRRRPACVVAAETYPAEAYRLVGAGFGRQESKRHQADRAGKAAGVLRWASLHGIELTPEASSELEAGFGSGAEGEDAFDAMLLLLKMVEVAEGRRPEATEDHAAPAAWDGWILGW